MKKSELIKMLAEDPNGDLEIVLSTDPEGNKIVKACDCYDVVITAEGEWVILLWATNTQVELKEY